MVAEVHRRPYPATRLGDLDDLATRIAQLLPDIRKWQAPLLIRWFQADLDTEQLD